MRVDISGSIIPNDSKWLYEWFGMEATCPKDIEEAIAACSPGEKLEVYINSPGGEITAGSAIYTALRAFTGKLEINVVGLAASAASVIMCAGHCLISPTAMVMIHCVSSSAQGNHQDMEKMAETLSKADRAMCQAYVLKTGKSESELLELMDKTHWMTAEEAVKMGFCDGIMESPTLSASFGEPIFDAVAVSKVKKLLEDNDHLKQEKRFIELGGTI